MGEDRDVGVAASELAATMRAIGERCVWTRSLDHAALVPYLVEEAWEVVDAIGDGDAAELRDELGDLLWQVVLHADLASRAGQFELADVFRTIDAKMRRRHPHVFAGVRADTVEDVERVWNAAKAAERAGEPPAPRREKTGLPALAIAQKRLRRGQPVAPPAAPRTDDERVADELLAVLERAQAAGVDAEAALRARLQAAPDTLD